jgi:c-di-GMP-binding flagellar brake protein YcgR
MGANLWPIERRRHPRVHLGVPVRVHLAGEPQTLTLELVNVSAGGSYFRTSGRVPRRGQWVAFGFVVSEYSVCAARGRVVRVDGDGFGISIDNANGAFQAFVNDISGSFMIAA